MNVTEHIQTARDFLVASDWEFAVGNVLQGSEKLWEASAHALMALMTEEVKISKGNREFRIAVRRLADDRGDQHIYWAFVIAENFYYNSQFGYMENWQISDNRRRLKEVLARIVPEFATEPESDLGGGSGIGNPQITCEDWLMDVSEHAQTAREFLAASDREFAAGDILQASEKLWGAATHALMAVMQSNGQTMKSHREMQNAARRLAIERNDVLIVAGFDAAERFHINFYHGYMDDWQIEDGREDVRRFVERLLPAPSPTIE